MTDSEHVAYSGFISDHLYADCEALTRNYDRPSPYLTPDFGKRLKRLVDPLHPDICSMCFRRWEETCGESW